MFNRIKMDIVLFSTSDMQGCGFMIAFCFCCFSAFRMTGTKRKEPLEND